MAEATPSQGEPRPRPAATVEKILTVDTIAINAGGGGGKLVKNDASREYTPQQIKDKTKITIKKNSTTTESNLPDFLRENLVGVAKDLLSESEKKTLLAKEDNLTIEEKLDIYKALVTKAGNPQYGPILEKHGIVAGMSNITPELFVASVQAAAIDEARPAMQSVDTKTTNKPADNRRRKVYTEMTYNENDQLELSGIDMKTVNKKGQHIEIPATVREDLMAAQQIFNSLLPTENLVEIVKLENQLRTAATAQEKDVLAHTIVETRQKFYRAILCAYDVQPEKNPLSYTDEDRRLAEKVKARAKERLTYTDFTGKSRTSERGALNAVDANRITTIELLKALGVPEQASNQLQTTNTWDHLQMTRHAQTAKDPDLLAATLGIDKNLPHYELIRQTLNERINTDLRLAGLTNTPVSRFQELTRGDLAENLQLNVFRSMGLKGIEFLYRRGQSVPREKIKPTPTPEDPKIKLMKRVQGPADTDTTTTAPAEPLTTTSTDESSDPTKKRDGINHDKDKEGKGSYGYPESPESKKALQEWVKRSPNRIQTYTKITNTDGSVRWVNKDGDPVQRDAEKERSAARQYFEKIKEKNPKYYTYLESLATSSTMPPMKDECRVAINVPAWMEEKSLPRFLSQYTGQTDREGKKLDPNLYEINILINRKTGTEPDNSIAVIEQFIAEQKALGNAYNINFVDVEFDPPFNNVGNARKTITDLTLLRSLKRTGQTEQLYIESEDADMLFIDPRTVINLINKLDNNPHLDAVRGVQDRTPEEMMKNDYLFLDRRLGNFLELFFRSKRYRPENNPRWDETWNRVISGGWNTAFTAEAYALIDGYNPYSVMGEDMEIGKKIAMIRGDENFPNLDVVGTIATRSDSSPRRYLSEIITKRAAYSDAFMDDDLNQFIREASLDQLHEKAAFVARIDDSNKERFGQMIDGYFRYFTRNFTPSEAEARKVFNSGMFWLGFKKGDYEYLSNGKVQVTNWTNVQNALNTYREHHDRPRTTGERTTREFKPLLETQSITNDVLLPDTPPLRFTLAELEESTSMIAEGNYIICLDKRLDNGYLGSVFAGYDRTTGELIAFKRVSRGAVAYIAENSGFPAGTQDAEDVVKATTSNPTILTYRDKIITGEDDVYKTYPLASSDLDHYLLEKKQLSPKMATAVAIKITEALKELHANGIIHIAVAPENILIGADGKVYLGDLDAVCSKNGMTGQYAREWGGGSPFSIPPELYGDNPTLSESIDTYETCVLLYKSIVGTYPHESSKRFYKPMTLELADELHETHQAGIFSIPESVPDSIKTILKKGINPDPTKRYQTANDLLQDLFDSYNQLS